MTAKTRRASTVCLATACVALLALGSPARPVGRGNDKPRAASKKLVGTWRVVSATLQERRGARGTEFYGPNPQGRLIFDKSNNYTLIVLRDDLKNVRFASGNRETGTDDENRKVVQGSIANYGRYYVRSDRDRGDVLVLEIDRATFPNWNGVTQERPIGKLTDDRLEYEVNPASAGGESIATFVWERVR